MTGRSAPVEPRSGPSRLAEKGVGPGIRRVLVEHRQRRRNDARVMKLPTFFRRRWLWIPTALGWAIMAVIAVLVIVGIARNLYSFLAVSEPVGAPVLIVEGWMGPDALEDALALYRQHRYERIITTGLPADPWTRRQGYESYADRAAAYLIERGVPRSVVTAVRAPASAQDRTYLSAVMVRDWARLSTIALPAVDILSVGPHARRSRLLYQLAFGPSMKIGVMAARQD